MWRDQLTPESRLDIGDSLLEQIRDMKVQHNSNSNNNEGILAENYVRTELFISGSRYLGSRESVASYIITRLSSFELKNE